MEADLHPEHEQAPIPVTPRPKKSRTKVLLVAITVLILTTASGVGAYVWRDQEVAGRLKEKDDKISLLEKDLANTKAELRTAKTDNQKTTNSAESEVVKTAMLEGLKASVTSKNYGAAESYMAKTVRVIFAASEGMGNRTPAQAVSDMAYLNSATSPWDFNLSSAVLNGYRAGGYGSYFPTTALVGKSANNYLISFTFDTNNKVSGIFITGTTDVL